MSGKELTFKEFQKIVDRIEPPPRRSKSGLLWNQSCTPPVMHLMRHLGEIVWYLQTPPFEEQRLKGELAYLLWYTSRLGSELGLDMDDVARHGLGGCPD